MPDIRKHKGILGLMLIVVLLSFFCMTPERVSFVETAGLTCELSDESGMSCHAAAIPVMELSSVGNSVPESVARFAPLRAPLEEVFNREQNTSGIQLARFLAAVILILFFVHVTYNIVIHRYGYHMIDLWENITYIHEVDGKKGERSSVDNVL